MNYMQSENVMDRLFAVTKVNSLLKEYCGKDFEFSDPIDIKLVRGIYRRNTE